MCLPVPKGRSTHRKGKKLQKRQRGHRDNRYQISSGISLDDEPNDPTPADPAEDIPRPVTRRGDRSAGHQRTTSSAYPTISSVRQGATVSPIPQEEDEDEDDVPISTSTAPSDADQGSAQTQRQGIRTTSGFPVDSLQGCGTYPNFTTLPAQIDEVEEREERTPLRGDLLTLPSARGQEQQTREIEREDVQPLATEESQGPQSHFSWTTSDTDTPHRSPNK